MKYLVKRLREPSTYAGLATLSGIVLPLLGVSAAVTSLVASTLAGIATVVKDPGQPAA